MTRPSPPRLPCRSYRKRALSFAPPFLLRTGSIRRNGSRKCASKYTCEMVGVKYTSAPDVDEHTIVVLEGDETGQELLEEALRVLAPDVIGLELDFPRYDLSLAHRRATREPRRPRGRGGDPRARARPEGGDGDPRGPRRRRLAEPDPARGDRREGDRPHRPPDPRAIGRRRRPRADLDRADGRRRRVRREGMARRRGRRRGRVSHRADRAADLPRGRRVRVPPGRAHGREGLRRPEVHRQPDLRGDAEGGDGRGRGAPSGRSVRAAADRRDVRAAARPRAASRS